MPKRVLYQNTIVYTDPDSGFLRAVDQAEIFVYHAREDPNTAPQLAEIYEVRGGPTGDIFEKNPIITSTSGIVEFYADPGEYEIYIRDTQTGDPRVTSGSYFWNAVSGSIGGIPPWMIQPGSLHIGTMAPDTVRQWAAIGEVIDWWRPTPNVPLPMGFEICEGQTIPANQHDFGTGTPITLPDLRNLFVIGAEVGKVDGADSVNGEGPLFPVTIHPGQPDETTFMVHPHAPGIGGEGGSNLAKDLRHSHVHNHTHSVPFINHYHTGDAPDHYHSGSALAVGSHAHGPGTLYSTGHARSFYIDGDVQVGARDGRYNADLGQYPLDGQAAWADNLSTVTGGATDPAATGVSGNTGSPSHTAFTTSAGLSSGATPAAVASGAASPANTDLGSLTNPGGVSTPADFRPKHIGLLKLMKVRRN